MNSVANTTYQCYQCHQGKSRRSVTKWLTMTQYYKWNFVTARQSRFFVTCLQKRDQKLAKITVNIFDLTRNTKIHQVKIRKGVQKFRVIIFYPKIDIFISKNELSIPDFKTWWFRSKMEFLFEKKRYFRGILEFYVLKNLLKELLSFVRRLKRSKKNGNYGLLDALTKEDASKCLIIRIESLSVEHWLSWWTLDG